MGEIGCRRWGTEGDSSENLELVLSTRYAIEL